MNKEFTLGECIGASCEFTFVVRDTRMSIVWCVKFLKHSKTLNWKRDSFHSVYQTIQSWTKVLGTLMKCSELSLQLNLKTRCCSPCMQCWKSREIAVTSFQRSIVCGARGEVRQVKLYSHVGKCAKSPNLSQDVFVHDCSCATLSSGKPWYIPRLWIAIGNTVANTHNAKQDGKVGCDTLECTKTLLYSVYFMVWHKPWHKHEVTGFLKEILTYLKIAGYRWCIFGLSGNERCVFVALHNIPWSVLNNIVRKKKTLYITCFYSLSIY